MRQYNKRQNLKLQFQLNFKANGDLIFVFKNKRTSSPYSASIQLEKLFSHRIFAFISVWNIYKKKTAAR
jgi:hypothetical protein